VEILGYPNKQTNKQTTMKNKILATLVVFGIAGNVSAIEINENLSINGFIDGSYQHYDNGGSNGTPTDQSLGLDEAELNFITNVGGLTGVVNIDTNLDNDVELEQAHITYSLDSGVSFTLGKYGSALGFEGEDPTGLYTFSRAYGDVDANADNSNNNAFNFAHVDANVVEGFTIAYANDVFSIAASFENALNTDAEDDDLNLELSFSYTGIDNVTIGGGYFFDNQSDSANEIDALNLHVSTTMGKLFLAAEYSELDRGTAGDLDAWMVLADYDFNDKLGAALRLSSNEKDNNRDYEKVTIAPNYAITDSLGAILEYSDVEDAGTDGNEVALELLYTF
jgi:hypothetical protein